jgi:hypothetical protein
MIFDLAQYKRLLILFLGAILVFAGVFVVWDLVYVDKSTPTRSDYNLQAFPKVQPKDLPDAAISLSACTNELKPCTSDFDCLQCDESGKFKCTPVERDGQYEINGIKVPKGQYCLPRTDRTQKCNKYTGKWVWSTASDCPPDENGMFSSQCWKCMCLYPDLFYDQKDCSTQIACINSSDKTFQSADAQRKRNRLVGAPYSKFPGQYWDPSAIDSIDSAVLEENPYATDSKGRPQFYCECDTRDERNQKEFLRLPNDPYTCHVDMCYNRNQKISTTYMCRTSGGQVCDPYETPADCKCSCNCFMNNAVTRPDGTCQIVEGMCLPGRTNNTVTGCECGSFKKRICRSALKNTSNTTLPECKDANNPFGEECYDQCKPNPCTNGACIYDDSKPSGQRCDCSGVLPTQNDAIGQPVKFTSNADCTRFAADPGSVAASHWTINASLLGKEQTVWNYANVIPLSGCDKCRIEKGADALTGYLGTLAPVAKFFLGSTDVWHSKCDPNGTESCGYQGTRFNKGFNV